LKLLFVLLLAVNALLLSMASGWLNLWEARDPDRLRRQIDAERITVLSPTAAQPGGPGSTSTGAAITEAPGAVTDPVKAASGSGLLSNGKADALSSTSAKVEGNTLGNTALSSTGSQGVTSPGANTSAPTNTLLACLEFPPIELDKAQAVEESMKQVGITVELKPTEGNASFIVYLAPSESVKEAQRKLAELKRLGISDAFLMQDGPLKLGISLGLFRSEDGAKALVQLLAAKGIRSAKISAGSALRSAKVTVKASGTEAQLARVRQAATEVNLSLKPCAT
jgi:hypothetical protein